QIGIVRGTRGRNGVVLLVRGKAAMIQLSFLERRISQAVVKVSLLGLPLLHVIQPLAARGRVPNVKSRALFLWSSSVGRSSQQEDSRAGSHKAHAHRA